MQCATAEGLSPRPRFDYAALGAQIVQQLSNSRFAAAEERFESSLSNDFPQAKLSEQWRAFLVGAGKFVKIKAASVANESGDYHVVTMRCAFQKAPNSNVLVTFNRDGRIAGLYFGPQPTEVVDQWTTPSYAAVSLFHEISVSVESGPWHLPGTLTLPNGRGPFPAVVLVPGSPPLDQDSTLGPNKIFKDLAWGLASRGIAVLRYTKRTHQYGAGLGNGVLSSFSLSEELGDDARAAISLMAARNAIDHRRTYLLGHSLGGVVVPRIAGSDPRIAGIVTMGAPPGNLLTVLVRRAEEGARLGGAEAAEHSKMVPILKGLRDGSFAPGDVVELYGQRSPVGYWLSLQDHESAAVSAKLTMPVLVLTAGHDVQALPDAFENWKLALAGHNNVTLKLYPSLFHLFLPSTATEKGEDTPEDWARPGHVAPEVVNDISSWIHSSDGV